MCWSGQQSEGSAWFWCQTKNRNRRVLVLANSDETDLSHGQCRPVGLNTAVGIGDTSLQTGYGPSFADMSQKKHCREKSEAEEILEVEAPTEVRPGFRFFEPRLALEEINEEVVRPPVRDMAATSASASEVSTKQWHTHVRCGLARRDMRCSGVAGGGQRAAGSRRRVASSKKQRVAAQ